MKSPFVKVLNIIVDVLVVCVLIISLLVLTMVLTAQGEGEVPSVFGKAPISVLTNSMHGDAPDDFDQGDLLICEVVDKSADNKFEKGDIITFKQDINSDDVPDYVTHRIYKVNKDGTFQTKGDNNPSYDQNPNATTVFPNISKTDILAKYTGTKIAGFGGVVQYLQTPLGFFLCILLPMILFFLYQAVRVVLNVIAYNKEKALISAKEAIASADLTEEQKQKAIAEYLAAQKTAEDNAPETETESEEPEKEPEQKSDETEEKAENNESE